MVQVLAAARFAPQIVAAKKSPLVVGDPGATGVVMLFETVMGMGDGAGSINAARSQNLFLAKKGLDEYLFAQRQAVQWRID